MNNEHDGNNKSSIKTTLINMQKHFDLPNSLHATTYAINQSKVTEH